jgi:uncharacterized peroxidase-related enzyme
MTNQTYNLDLPLRTTEDPDPAVAALLAGPKKALGMVPNMYAAMANFPGLLETYSFGYDRFRKTSGFSMAEQEIIFLTVSRANACTYCVAAHSMIADTMSKVPAEITDAIRSDAAIADPRLAALRSFTDTMVRSRGNPTTLEAEAFLAAGYSKEQMLAVLLAISIKTISNYANHLFHTKVDDAFAHRAWQDPEAA